MIRPISEPGPISILATPDQEAHARKVLELFTAPDPHVAVFQLLEEHSARVTELIRANSREVIKRRVLNARLKLCLVALQAAAAKFRFYATSHRAKVPSIELDLILYDVERDPSLQETVDRINKKIEDTLGKAWVNDQMAAEMEYPMTVEINPDDYGRA